MSIAPALTCLLFVAVDGLPSPALGQRPYEMVWADRVADDHPPLVDFETLDGWKVETSRSEAALVQTREQQLWGDHVARLTYRASGANPLVRVVPPAPVAFSRAIDCVNFWVYGNNWAWVVDRTTPQVTLSVVFKSAAGQEVRVRLRPVNWREWFLLHQKLSPEEAKPLRNGGALVAIELTGGRNTEDRVLYFDNLSVYQEKLPPLVFLPRPKRGVEMFDGQGSGTNTGPGVLPFPTRPETILPDNLTKDFANTVDEESPGVFVFRYRGGDGELVYRYRPQSGTLGDLTAQWSGRGAFRPMADGGVFFAATGDSIEAHAPPNPVLVSVRRQGDAVESTWNCTIAGEPRQYQFRLRLWQKSLVVDVHSPAGAVGEVRFGRAAAVEAPRLVTLPFLACEVHRPAVLVMGPTEKPLFLMGLVDHCRSNGSALFAFNEVNDKGAVYNGGVRYLSKTDGRRNACFERLFLTVSPLFEEVLPNVPNPKSPWMHVAGERVWRAHGASDRQCDYDIWKRIVRRGMAKVLVTDHETGWRDGGESFTFRTKAAPGKGGDEGQFRYARQMHALGIRYGIYNNYTDFAPVNEYWHADRVTRLSDGQWQSAWARCYNPKPAWAVEMEAKIAEEVQRKFKLDTAYCDVHTAVQPWRYCDFDARVPGAGTFAATFYAYGEIMLHQKKTWNGPVYSEGNNHWYYCGLTDGNYGQDQNAKLAENPWLVDFDLRKLHPLCCNFGMGNLEMFYGRRTEKPKTPAERDAWLDRFLAATLAFGHTGFLTNELGPALAARSYFAVQQVHARYAQDTVAEIRYADAAGKLFETSRAVANGAFRRSHVAVRYASGLEVMVNGHPSDNWTVDGAVLPANGWLVKDPSRALQAGSVLVDGHRCDYVDSPAYLYGDGRGRAVRFPKLYCDGPVAALKLPDGAFEVIPQDAVTVVAVALGGQNGTAEALGEDRQSLGPAATRLSRRVVHIEPVANAVSYLVRPAGMPAVVLRSDRDSVVPGERVIVRGREEHSFAVPLDAKPGTRIWKDIEGAAIDFTVVPLADAAMDIDGNELQLRLVARLPAAAEGRAVLGGIERQVALAPGKPATVAFPAPVLRKDAVLPLALRVTAGPYTMDRTWWLKRERQIVPVASLPEEFSARQRLRKQADAPLDPARGGAVHYAESTAGNIARRAIFMHPPYKGAVGCVYAELGPIQLPKHPPAALRTLVGKTDGSDRGDGILFRAAVVDGGQETVVAEKQWSEHGWTPLEADLSAWAGKRVVLRLIADVGPNENSSGDWAAWAPPRLESLRPEPVDSIHDAPVVLRHEEGTFPFAASIDALQKAPRGTLHFEGIGLQGAKPYVSRATLNGVPLGPLPAAGGNERDNVWQKARVALSPQAVRSLGATNRVAIQNPDGDSFKVRRFWVELELSDGRRISSRVATTAFTQPENWRYAEGVGVPAGRDIELEIRFDVAGEETKR